MADDAYTKYGQYEIWQDGMCVAKCHGPDHIARRDAMHYAMMYGLDGPVTIYRRVKGKKIEVQP